MALPPGASRTGGSGEGGAIRILVHGEAGAEGPGGSGGDGTVRTRGAAAPAASPNRSPSNTPGEAIRTRKAAAPASGVGSGP